MRWVERQARESLGKIEGRDGPRAVTGRMIEDYRAGTLLGEVSEGFGDVVLRAQAIATQFLARFHQGTRIETLSSLTARVAGTSVPAASGGVLGASL